MAADGIGQRFQQGSGFADPVSQRGTIKINAFAVEDLTLAIERQVIGILADQNMGQDDRARSGARAAGLARTARSTNRSDAGERCGSR